MNQPMQSFGAQAGQSLSLNPELWLSLFRDGKHDALVEEIEKCLKELSELKVLNMTPDFRNLVNLIVKLIFRIFGDESFVLTRHQAARLLEYHATLSNLVFLSEFNNADMILKLISSHPNNFGKTLVLLSHYSAIEPDIEDYFAKDDYLASLWVAAILSNANDYSQQSHAVKLACLKNKAVLDNYTIKKEGYPHTQRTVNAGFYSSYISEMDDYPFRRRIHEDISKRFKYPYHHKSPDLNNILVISDNMRRSITADAEHAVYRSVAPQLYELKKKFQISLLHLGPQEGSIFDRELFDEVYFVKNGGVDIERLHDVMQNNFGIIYFPDIGMNTASLVVSSMRLAPIQITSYGHPLTSCSAKVDYFIGGEDVEKDGASEYYRERLVLLPGLGVEPYKMTFDSSSLEKEKSGANKKIMCSWGRLKTNPHMLGLLQKITDESKENVEFTISGVDARDFTNLVASKELEGSDSNIKVSIFTLRDLYMREFYQHDLAIDSFPFGSYNRVIDSLLVGVPMVVYEGKKAPTRFGAALMRQIGLEELIATNDEEYVEKTVQLIDDEAYRQSTIEKMEAIDLDKQVFNTGREKYYLDAFDAIIHDYGHRKGKRKRTKGYGAEKPIRIAERH